MIHTARAHGMLVMLGCMVETSLGISAAAQISGFVDFVDLGVDALADDPYAGPVWRQRPILLPEEPGLGVEPRRFVARPGAALRHPCRGPVRRPLRRRRRTA